MRARQCIAAGSSISAAGSSSSSSSSGATAGRGRRPRGRGFSDQPRSRDRGGSEGAFASGDAQLRTVSEENYGRRVGCRDVAGAPELVTGPPSEPGIRFPPPHPGFHPQPPPFFRPPLPRYAWQPPLPPGFGPQRPPEYGAPPPPPWNPVQVPPRDFRPPPPRLRQRPADYRSWVPSWLPRPPPDCERFRVLSYNVLADYLARDHQSKLYFHIPPEVLDWKWRKNRLLIEFGLWSPDILCLQEVDKFQDLEEELAQHGYNGTWKMRTGNAVDGCAIFWRTNRFVLRHEEHIEFAKLGLRDNVAQICVLESSRQRLADNGSKPSSSRSDPSLKTGRVVVCNIHVLYNPKRGDIKLGQVRVLLDRAYSVSKIWNDAPVIICGDFNCTPKSPLYNFISGQKLSLSGLARNEVSGQHSACIYRPWASTGFDLYRAHPPHDNNDGKAASFILDNHQSGIKDHHKTQNNEEGVFLVDKCSSPQVSEKLCTYSQLENEEGTRFDSKSGVEVDGFGSLPLCKEKDLPKEITKDINHIIEPTKVITFMESEGMENFTSVNASSQGKLHTVVELQSDDNHVKDSSLTVETLNKHDEQVNNQHFIMSGNRRVSHDPLYLLEEKHVSTTHTSYTFSTMPEDVIHLKVTKDSANSCHNMLAFEGKTDSFSPEDDSEKRLHSKSGSDKFPADDMLDISTYERVLKISTVGEGTPLAENIEPSTSLVSCRRKADLDVSCQNEHKPIDLTNFLDTNLNLEAVDLSANDVKETMKDLSCSSGQVVINTHEKLPGVTEEIASQNIIYSKSSSQYAESPFSSDVDTNASEVASGLIVEEEFNSDSSFLAELHGIGNVPDLSQGIFVAEEIVASISPQMEESSKIQQKVYDPFLWTPMEIEAASGNAQCTLLEHNLNLKSAYTEVRDYAGTKDSCKEPQVTSYNRQFMGTVDYIWHSEELHTVQVLDTIPKHVLLRTSGFPTKKWGSDHLALACEFAFKKA